MSTRKFLFVGLMLLALAFVSNGLVRIRHYPKQILSQNIVGNDFFMYTAEEGDTFFRIANKFGITLNDLQSSNPSLGCPNCIISSISGVQVNIPVQSTLSVIEAEWPVKMEVNRSDTIRLSLKPVNTQQVAVTAEVDSHTAIAMTPLPILGTPAVPMKDVFGPSYEACALANLQGSAFDIKSITTETDCKPLGQNPITWDWSIYPKSDGSQSIISSVEIRWVPTGEDKKTPQIQIWRYRFDTVVETPFIKVGQLNISTLISGLLGTLLSIPWIYERIKERRKQKESKKAGIVT